MSHLVSSDLVSSDSACVVSLSKNLKRGLVLLSSALLVVVANGCATRTVYVREGNAPRAERYDAPPQNSGPQSDGNYGGYEDTYRSPPQVDLGINEGQEFHDSLSPYGRWQHHGRFGNVFVPSVRVVGNGYRPYTQGHWEYTEWGWTWASHLPFGWATSHYGRWFYDSRLGWAWVPGTRWAPSWVSWRTGGRYVGWAPLPPGAVFGGRYTTYNTSWVFVTEGNFGRGSIFPLLIRGRAWDDCYRSTRVSRNTVNIYGRAYYRGPDPRGIRDRGGRVTRRGIRDTDRERATTRPPSGVVIGRSGRRDGGDHERTDGRSRAGTSRNEGASRSRDHDNDRGRDRSSDRGRENAADERTTTPRRTGPDRGRDPRGTEAHGSGPDRGRNPAGNDRAGDGPDRGRNPASDGTRAPDRGAARPDNGLQRPYDRDEGMNVPRRTGRPDLSRGNHIPNADRVRGQQKAAPRTTPSRRRMKNPPAGRTSVAPPPKKPSTRRAAPARKTKPARKARPAPARKAKPAPPPAKKTKKKEKKKEKKSRKEE
ncbi:MAG: hypothetical protein GY822_16735 [Deltaproteobacteria bacterium]|nr:hypothetical protein [Deltaproteobacteria bacterium]